MTFLAVILLLNAGFFTGWVVRSYVLSNVFEDQTRLLQDLDRENTRLTETVLALHKLHKERSP